MLLFNLFHLIERKIVARAAAARVVRELNTYNDRELADLGIDYLDIKRIAAETAAETEQTMLADMKRRRDLILTLAS
ncbi:DUF1127 domain-containing protein [Methylovirgula sp. 4M-Z18]|nr:DUF1127 domain-containing protein [Methylovirgula sp. 4M-Z18]